MVSSSFNPGEKRRLYVNDRPLTVTANATGADISLTGRESQDRIREILQQFEDNAIPYLTIYSEQQDQTWELILNIYKILKAAGGLVYSPAGHLLMIFRNGHWDLPKGKIEDGESEEEAALREVKEECGISRISITSPFTVTYHTYWFGNDRILKETHWYKMHADDSQPLTAQSEEGIELVQWMDEAGIQEAMKKTYASIRDLLRSEIKATRPPAP